MTNRKVLIFGDIYSYDEALDMLDIKSTKELITQMRADSDIRFYNPEINANNHQEDLSASPSTEEDVPYNEPNPSPQQNNTNNQQQRQSIHEQVEPEYLVVKYSDLSQAKLSFFITHLINSNVDKSKYNIDDYSGTITFIADSLSNNDKLILQTIEANMIKEYQSTNALVKVVASTLANTICGTAGKLIETSISVGSIFATTAMQEAHTTTRRSKVNIDEAKKAFAFESKINNGSIAPNAQSIFS